MKSTRIKLSELKSLIKQIILEDSNRDYIKSHQKAEELKKYKVDYERLMDYINNDGQGDLYLDNSIIDSLYDLKIVHGNLSLQNTPINSLGNLESVEGNLYLYNVPLQSLGSLKQVKGDLILHDTKIKSLENLQYVDGDLNIMRTPLNSFGNLKFVGGYLNIKETPMSKQHSEEQIRQMVDVSGKIYKA